MMVYINWLMYAAMNEILVVMCYLTNPIVALFCDEDGELPEWLKYWQPWNDSCDSSDYMKYNVPKLLDYNFSCKYITAEGVDESLTWLFRSRMFSCLKHDAEFSLKERLQRYFCRVLWLNEKCASGFKFHLLGVMIDNRKIKYSIKTEYTEVGNDGKHFTVNCTKPIYENSIFRIRLDIHLGWDLAEDPGYRKCEYQLKNWPFKIEFKGEE